jgi:hypothetical protein
LKRVWSSRLGVPDARLPLASLIPALSGPGLVLLVLLVLLAVLAAGVSPAGIPIFPRAAICDNRWTHPVAPVWLLMCLVRGTPSSCAFFPRFSGGKRHTIPPLAR